MPSTDSPSSQPASPVSPRAEPTSPETTLLELRGRPVLVTGGAGFIGSHLVDALVAAGARVRVLDNLATGRRDNLRHHLDRFGEAASVELPPVELLEGDLRDAAVCHDACRGVDLVFHQGALGSVPRSMEDPATSVAVNVTGTANLFAAARDAGVKRLVYASSSSVYGDNPALPKREGEEGRTVSPYAATKAMDEELARIFARCFGLEMVGLRYFNVYGPRQDPAGPYAAVIPRFFAAALAGEPMVIHGDGSQSRDFTYVADAVQANLLAATRTPAAGQADEGETDCTGFARVYNVAAGARTTVAELAEAIRKVVGGGPPPRHVDPRPGDVPHSLADLAAIRRDLGYRPAHDLRQGLRATLSHYLAASAANRDRE